MENEVIDKFRSIRNDFYHNDKLKYDSFEYFASIEYSIRKFDILNKYFNIEVYNTRHNTTGFEMCLSEKGKKKDLENYRIRQSWEQQNHNIEKTNQEWKRADYYQKANRYCFIKEYILNKSVY